MNTDQHHQTPCLSFPDIFISLVGSQSQTTLNFSSLDYKHSKKANTSTDPQDTEVRSALFQQIRQRMLCMFQETDSIFLFPEFAFLVMDSCVVYEAVILG
jgi:hypothetical protein